MWWTMDKIKLENAQAGKFFFSKGAMRFFASRVSDAVYQGDGGVFFVTSEQFRSHEYTARRMYTVHQFNPETKDVSTVGEFQAYKSRTAAHEAAKRAAKGE